MRAIRRFLKQVRVIMASVAALGLSALFAALIPAFRASRISPLEALRSE